MRIIPDDVVAQVSGFPPEVRLYDGKDTIEITDEEWDEISHSYNVYRNGLLLKGHTTCVTFAYWLKSLISLTGEGK